MLSQKEMEIYFRYRQISTNTPRSARSIKDKSGEFVFLFSFPFFKCELAFILTRLEAPRRLRRSRKKASQNSPAVPKFKKRGIATSIMFSPAAMISEALSVNWTPAATKTEVDCDFSFFFISYFCLLIKSTNAYIPQPRGEVVVWALSPSGSDLVRPLPFQHSDAAKSVAGAVGETWFLLLTWFLLRTLKKRETSTDKLTDVKYQSADSCSVVKYLLGLFRHWVDEQSTLVRGEQEKELTNTRKRRKWRIQGSPPW